MAEVHGHRHHPRGSRAERPLVQDHDHQGSRSGRGEQKEGWEERERRGRHVHVLRRKAGERRQDGLIFFHFTKCTCKQQ